MAITRVRGTVSRVFYQGRGAEVVEQFTVKGEERSTRWSAFFDDAHGLAEGDTVNVSGLHGDRIDEWEMDGDVRRSVRRTLNKARLATGDGAESVSDPSAGSAVTTTVPTSQMGAEPPADPWPSSDLYTGGGVPW